MIKNQFVEEQSTRNSHEEIPLSFPKSQTCCDVQSRQKKIGSLLLEYIKYEGRSIRPKKSQEIIGVLIVSKMVCLVSTITH